MLWVSWCRNKSFWQRFTCAFFLIGRSSFVCKRIYIFLLITIEQTSPLSFPQAGLRHFHVKSVGVRIVCAQNVEQTKKSRIWIFWDFGSWTAKTCFNLKVSNLAPMFKTYVNMWRYGVLFIKKVEIRTKSLVTRLRQILIICWHYHSQMFFLHNRFLVNANIRERECIVMQHIKIQSIL